MPGEVVHAEEGAVDSELLRRDRQLNALEQGLARGPGPGALAGAPVAEREESDALHVGPNRPAGLRQNIGRRKPAMSAAAPIPVSTRPSTTAVLPTSSGAAVCHWVGRLGW